MKVTTTDQVDLTDRQLLDLLSYSYEWKVEEITRSKDGVTIMITKKEQEK